jgi:hypothetical protein
MIYTNKQQRRVNMQIDVIVLRFVKWIAVILAAALLAAVVTGFVAVVFAETYVVADPNTTVAFGWDANTEPDLAGYRLYSTATPGVYEEQPVADVTTNTARVGVSEGQHWFVVTAYDWAGHESDPSNEVALVADYTEPNRPTGFECQNLQIINININR